MGQKLYQDKYQLKMNRQWLFVIKVGILLLIAFMLYKLTYNYADRKIHNAWGNNEQNEK